MTVLDKFIKSLDKIDFSNYRNIEDESVKILFQEFNRRYSDLYLKSNQSSSFHLYFFLNDIKFEERIGNNLRLIPDGVLINFGKGLFDLLHLYQLWECNKHKLPYYQKLTSEEELFYPIIRIIEYGGYIHREGKLFSISGETFSIKLDYYSNSYLDSLDI